MELLPRLEPQWMADDPARLCGDTGTLWLMVMGAVMMAVGGGYLVRMGWETLPWERYQAWLRVVVEEAAEEVSPGADIGAESTTRLRH